MAGFCTSLLVGSVLVGTLVLVYRKYVRHKRLLSQLERGEVEGEVQPVLSISLQCQCEPEDHHRYMAHSLEEALIQF